eukprot:scaffold95318_cov24-Phaeocystis_antarctica.AAC.1
MDKLSTKQDCSWVKQPVVCKRKLLASNLPRSPQQSSRAVRGMPGAPFGSTKSASSYTTPDWA